MKPMRGLLGAFVLMLASGWCLAASVNINNATAPEIAQGISGVGEKKAQAIVANREANGPFKSADDLTRVNGIGMATIDKNRDNITVK